MSCRVLRSHCEKGKTKSSWTCNGYLIKPTTAAPTVAALSTMRETLSHHWNLTTCHGCINGYVSKGYGLKRCRETCTPGRWAGSIAELGPVSAQPEILQQGRVNRVFQHYGRRRRVRGGAAPGSSPGLPITCRWIVLPRPPVRSLQGPLCGAAEPDHTRSAPPAGASHQPVQAPPPRQAITSRDPGPAARVLAGCTPHCECTCPRGSGTVSQTPARLTRARWPLPGRDTRGRQHDVQRAKRTHIMAVELRVLFDAATQLPDIKLAGARGQVVFIAPVAVGKPDLLAARSSSLIQEAVNPFRDQGRVIDRQGPAQV